MSNKALAIDSVTDWNWKRRFFVVCCILVLIGFLLNLVEVKSVRYLAEMITLSGAGLLATCVLRLLLWIIPEVSPKDRYSLEFLILVFAIVLLGLGFILEQNFK